MIELKEFEARKRDHLQHALDLSNQTSGQNGLERMNLSHDALPEIDFSEVDFRSPGINGSLSPPFFVAGMTAGHDKAYEINYKIASICEKKSWTFCLGSLRRDFEGLTAIDRIGELRSRFPSLSLVGNLGLSQLAEARATFLPKVKALIKNMGLNALAIHLNPLQEAIQTEGTPFFKHGLEVLGELSQNIDIPIILKETGSGFSELTLKKIKTTPFYASLYAMDISGLGGTHWGRIEGKRSNSEVHQKVAQTFQNWGVSTLDSLLNVRKVFAETHKKPQVWASGGIRSGLEASKCFALGAHRVGFAQPVLNAVMKGEEALLQWMEQIEYEVKVALFCTGSRTVFDLSREGVVVWKS